MSARPATAWLSALYGFAPLRIFLWVIAAFHAFAVTTPVANIAGLSQRGPWADAPVHWKLFDLAFLALDVAVVAGVVMRSPVGPAAFLLAATLQVILYLGFPSAFSAGPEEAVRLARLIWFNAGSLGVFAALLVVRARIESR